MAGKNYQEILNDIHMDASDALSEGNSIEDKKAALLKEVGAFRNIIPEFFSVRGEANTIRRLYNDLADIDYAKNVVIPFVDVNLGAHIYWDYYTGMMKFVDNVRSAISSQDEEKLEVMKDQLQTAINGDQLFIDSVFGGSNNKRKDEELTGAISNVEFLIDFIQMLDNIQNNIDGICIKCAAEHEVMNKCVTLVFSSVESFCYRTILTILDTYELILQKMYPELANPVKVESVMMIF